MRMRRNICSNTALDHRILLLILKNLDDQIISDVLTPERKNFLIVIGTYLSVSFCASLRGNKGFMMDLAPIREH